MSICEVSFFIGRNMTEEVLIGHYRISLFETDH